MADRGEGPGRHRPRRWSDDELVARVLACADGRPCPEWEALAGALAEYAFPRIATWARQGTLRARAARAGSRGGAVLGLGRVRLIAGMRGPEADALAIEVVMAALRTFRERGLPRWRADGGRSLASFFIAYCHMSLPDAYERWARAERPDHSPVVGLPGGEVEDPAPLPHDLVAYDEAVRRLVADDRVVEVIVTMKLAGHSTAAVARALQAEGHAVTPERVRDIVRRLRPRLP